MQRMDISTPYGNVSYWDIGDKRNPTIVCFHGLAGNGLYSFGELLPFIKKHFHVIVLDSPGHGKTTAFESEEAYLFSNMAAWLNQILKRIVKGSYYMMGHSWGADVALHFTRYYPKNVLGLVLLDGAFTFPQNQPEMTFTYAYSGWQNYMEQAIYLNKTDIFNEYQTYTQRWDSEKESYVASLFTTRQDGKFELMAATLTVLAIIKAFFAEPFTDAYSFINAPTLLLYASHPLELNEARTKGVSQLVENIEDITIEKIDDSSHMLQWDQPEQIANRLLAWAEKKGSLQFVIDENVIKKE